MNKIRNILLVGSSGGGKSAFANTLINKNGNFTEVFKESAGSVSQTKNYQVEELEQKIDGKKVTYRIIDTIGIGDTSLPEKEVAYKIAKVANELREGISQVFFVTGGRFIEKEVGVFGLLSGTLFGEKMLDFTTVVRTNFYDFEDEEECGKDYQDLINGKEIGSKLIEKIGKSKVIYIDNPPLKGKAKRIEANKEIRETAREKLLNYLRDHEVVYEASTLPLWDLNNKLDKLENRNDKEQVKSIVWETFDRSFERIRTHVEFGGEMGQKFIPVFGSTIGVGFGFGTSVVGGALEIGALLTKELVKGGADLSREFGSGVVKIFSGDDSKKDKPELLKKINDLENQSKNSQQTIQGLENQKNNLQNQLITLEVERSGLQTQLSKLESQRSDLQKELTQTQNGYEDVLKINKVLSKELTTTEEQLKKELERVKASLETLENQKNNLQSQLGNWTNAFANQDSAQVKQNLEQLQRERDEIRKQLNDLENIPLEYLKRTTYEGILFFLRNTKPRIAFSDLETKYSDEIEETINSLSLPNLLASATILRSAVLNTSLAEGLILSEQYVDSSNSLTTELQVTSLINDLTKLVRDVHRHYQEFNKIVNKENHPFYLAELSETQVILSQVQQELVKLERRKIQLSQQVQVLIPGN